MLEALTNKQNGQGTKKAVLGLLRLRNKNNRVGLFKNLEPDCWEESQTESVIRRPTDGAVAIKAKGF